MLDVRGVDDQVGGLVGLVEDEARGARVVAVLGDEPLAELVDHDAGQQLRGWVEGRGDERLVHHPQLTAGRGTEPDPEAVVVGGGRGEQLGAELRGVGGHHLWVADVATGRDHHRPRPDGAPLVVAAPLHPHDCAAALGADLDDEVGGAGLEAHLDGGLGDALRQGVQDDLRAPGVARLGHLVTARCRPGEVAEGVHLLVAGVHQPLGTGLDHRLVRVERALELHAERLDPVEVLDAVLAEGPDLGLVRVRADGHQVLGHLLRGVLDADCLLHRRTAAEVEVAPGHRAGPAVLGGPLQQHDSRPCPCRLERRAATRDAEADDNHVHLVAPRLDVGGVDRRGRVEIHARSLRRN